jgi:GT2 family glycosyltransferase
MTQRLDLSVVIATYNRAHLLGDALAALAGQQTPPGLRWEVIVVDNNSRDDTPRVVAGMTGRMPMPTRYVLETKQGMSHARNRGVRESGGAVVGILDDDVLPWPDWAAGVVTRMEEWKADGIGGRILPRWETPPPRWLAGNRQLQQYCFAILDHAESCELTYPVQGRGQIWGSNMAFRREVFDDVGYFDTGLGRSGDRLYRGGEEQLFVNRALQHGWRMVYDPSVAVYHRIGADRLRKGYLRKFFLHHGEGHARADTSAHSRRILGAPRWAWFLSARRLASWSSHTLLARPDAFARELDFLYECGKLWGYWKFRSSVRRDA